MKKARVRRTCNHDAFLCIETEEQAYWLGFLSADGWIGGDRIVGIGLARRDREHLQKFLDFVECDGAICDSKANCNGRSYETSSASVTSRSMVSCLATHGVVPRKSLTLKPWGGPQHLMRHYWRGIIDGDGSVSDGTTKANGTYDMTCNGSKSICEAFQRFAFDNTGSRGCVVPNSSIYCTRFAGRFATRKVVSLLYSNCCIALERKMRSAAVIMGDEKPEPEKLGVSRERLIELVNEHKTWSRVISVLGTSKRTLYRLRRDYGLNQYTPYHERGMFPEGSAWCRLCKSLLPSSMFSIDRRAKSGLMRSCKPCTSKYRSNLSKRTASNTILE